MLHAADTCSDFMHAVLLLTLSLPMFTNKRHLGSAPKSHFCDLTGKTEVIDLSDLMTLFLTWGVYIANRRKEHSMFSKTYSTD
jgi:hypothetical protein